MKNDADKLPPSKERKTALEFFDTNRAALFQAAQWFAIRLQQPSEVFAAPVPRPEAFLAAAPVLSQGKFDAPRVLSQADLAARPILSQANAVGQGFDIFGSFDTDSLMRPLVDLSRAPTQVFTFLGKEYLIPAYITAVESTSSYANVAAGENRDGFQNSIAAHAGDSTVPQRRFHRGGRRAAGRGHRGPHWHGGRSTAACRCSNCSIRAGAQVRRYGLLAPTPAQ